MNIVKILGKVVLQDTFCRFYRKKNKLFLQSKPLLIAKQTRVVNKTCDVFVVISEKS